MGRVRHSSGRGVAKLGCGVAQLGCCLAQLGCGVAVGNASACCKAGPGSILGSAPHGSSSLAERRSGKDTRTQTSANGEE
jgi:hypothetical protein